MIRGHDSDRHNGAENTNETNDRETAGLSPQLRIPKNRSTGNLALMVDQADKARYRSSLDASSYAFVATDPDHDSTMRSFLFADHEHRIGPSGLGRIRQQQPIWSPTLPTNVPGRPDAHNNSSSSNSNSNNNSFISRSTSLTALFPINAHNFPLSSVPSSPNFAEDLSRFPSESLHSFSFAHQTEELLHSRQNVLQRSIEFMQDRMGRTVSPSAAAIASAQARASGDYETQNMLNLLAHAQVVGASNLPHADAATSGPLTDPAQVSPENVFDHEFNSGGRRTASPGPMSPEHQVSSTNLEAAPRHPVGKMEIGPARQDAELPVGSPVANENGVLPQAVAGSQPPYLKRSLTDTDPVALQERLIDTMARPYIVTRSNFHEQMYSPISSQSAVSSATNPSASMSANVHSHAARTAPASQAIFTTASQPPWTILTANDLACLVFGVTKAEVRKMGILEVVQEERRAWLEKKLLQVGSADSASDETDEDVKELRAKSPSTTSNVLGVRAGITAHLLGKPNSRSQPPKAPRRAQTQVSADPRSVKPAAAKPSTHHRNAQSRGVLICGDVVPIQKRNGATGSASIWVKEKRVGLIWVVEEIHEDVAVISLNDDGEVKKISGCSSLIWGFDTVKPGTDVRELVPRIPRQGIDPRTGDVDFAQVNRRKYFTCSNDHGAHIPCTVEQVRGTMDLRVGSFRHMAGIIVVSPSDLKIQSTNAAFCGALFGYERPDGIPINALVPNFDKILQSLAEEEGIELSDGIVIPEHSFRRAAASLALREGQPSASTTFLRPEGVPARHRDGSELRIDVQMRVVRSEVPAVAHDVVMEASDEEEERSDASDDAAPAVLCEVVYALWITYSRHLHTSRPHHHIPPTQSPLTYAASSGTVSPVHQPSPGQTVMLPPPLDLSPESDDSDIKPANASPASALTKQLKEAALNMATKLSGASAHKTIQAPGPPKPEKSPVSRVAEPAAKKTIDDYVILEDMGQGAYGQVKLAKHKITGTKIVLKYVTKRRILVDTWTRDRRLGTVPLEIHVLDYLRKPEFRHPNIVEMVGFFEDNINYYIEMMPHGLQGMDLFDYVELRTNMDESECRSIFVQVAQAVHHLHTKAAVVHRDIKDENVILDSEGVIKLIDFGSAAYIKSGPFQVFVGTIDYAAPEVLAGKPYGGKEQDVWALGILLYTIIYKENPFYNIDEIMDRDLRIPFTMSDESIELIRAMLNRDVAARYDIQQVIDHPWCQGFTSISPAQLGEKK